MSFSQLASLVWSISVIPDTMNEFEEFWDSILAYLEQFFLLNPQEIKKENMYQIVTLAKSLSYVD